MTKSIPTKRQVIAELERLLSVRRGLWPHQDDSVLHTIRCLELALQVVKEWKQKK